MRGIILARDERTACEHALNAPTDLQDDLLRLTDPVEALRLLSEAEPVSDLYISLNGMRMTRTAAIGTLERRLSQ